MNIPRMRVAELAIITGKDLIKSPYTIHNAMPEQRVINMPSERSVVDFDFHVLINCGTKEIVVKVPAIRPNTVI